MSGKNILIFIFILVMPLSEVSAQSELPSPEEFLGYKPGEAFTPYHRITEYFKKLSSESDKASLVSYGQTYEGRPLQVMIISAAENMLNLEELRRNNLRRTGMLEGEPVKNGKIIVWLSYNVHGNEASSSETSMVTAWRLIRGDTDIDKWLKNVIVIIDPCVNPDGRERYLNWYRQNKSASLNPVILDVQHHEPWPGGRTNHYLFDLNRDWSWASQKETDQRLVLYNQWMPQVHVDFHEQERNVPYYFAPAAKPFHTMITTWQRAFQQTIGQHNADKFDKNRWLYFTKERFDLLYPGYGDTYPTFNGAIGMTYEQAGGGVAGLGVITDTGDTLTLTDRISHHLTTGLATIEVSAQHAEELENHFIEYFRKARTEDPGPYKVYIVSHMNGEDKLHKIARLLDVQKISYGHIQTGRAIKAFDYYNNTETTVSVRPEDLIIPVRQPKSILTKVLFEKATVLQDSLTYDITAWSIPYAFGVETYAGKTMLTGYQEGYKFSPVCNSMPEDPYAFVFKRSSIRELALLEDLLSLKINVRTNLKAFSNQDRSFEPGSFVVTMADNRKFKGDMKSEVRKLADKRGIKLYNISTGLAESGIDIGSPHLELIKNKKVGLLSGEGVSSYSMGEIWFMFEQEMDMPINRIDTRYFSKTDLSDLDVMILPSGYYSDVLGEAELKKLVDWVSTGGRLILIGNALNYVTGKEGFSLKEYLNEEEESKVKDMKEKEDYLKKYENSERLDIKDMIIGGIFKVRLDDSHPLAFGYPGHYFTLKISDDRYALLDKGWNVGTISGQEDLVSGFAGSNTQWTTYKSLVLGAEEKGAGQIVYFVDDPVFRSFWENGKLLLGNAVFMPDE